MFDGDVMRQLFEDHLPTLERLGVVEQHLNDRFVDMKEPIRALVLALASGEPLLFIGPPGTGKSRLIRALCGRLGILDADTKPAAADKTHGYFEHLLTPFTEPGELFGYYNIGALQKTGNLERMDNGMMQHARIVFIDEVFNGSSAILNALLTIMNERILHDRGIRIHVKMEGMFAATNRVPETPDLRAIYDRFVLRCTMHNAPAQREPLARLLHAGWIETYGQPDTNPQPDLSTLLSELSALRQDIQRRIQPEHLASPQTNPAFFGNLTQCIQQARQYDLTAMSNRRVIKMSYIMLLHGLYHAAQQAEPAPGIGREELLLIPKYFLDRSDREVTEKMERLVLTMEP